MNAEFIAMLDYLERERGIKREILLEAVSNALLSASKKSVGASRELRIDINPKTGEIAGNVDLEDTAPEGAAADGKGHIFVNNEGKDTIQEIDIKTWKAVASWPVDPCKGPTGIAYDKASDRILVGCSNNSVVVNPNTGKVVATIKNGTRVDALGWDAAKKLMYIPNGGEGNVTVVHQDSPDGTGRIYYSRFSAGCFVLQAGTRSNEGSRSHGRSRKFSRHLRRS